MKKLAIILFLAMLSTSVFAQQNVDLEGKIFQGKNARILFNLMDVKLDEPVCLAPFSLSYTKKLFGLECFRDVSIDPYEDSLASHYSCQLSEFMDTDSKWKLFNHFESVLGDKDSKYFHEKNNYLNLEVTNPQASDRQTVLTIGSLVFVEIYSRHPEAMNLPPRYNFSMTENE